MLVSWYRCWELNLGSLQELFSLLTPELSLQSSPFGLLRQCLFLVQNSQWAVLAGQWARGLPVFPSAGITNTPPCLTFFLKTRAVWGSSSGSCSCEGNILSTELSSFNRLPMVGVLDIYNPELNRKMCFCLNGSSSLAFIYLSYSSVSVRMQVLKAAVVAISCILILFSMGFLYFWDRSCYVALAV